MHSHPHDRHHADHDHEHEHDHDRPLEQITHVHGGPPVLDIGGDVGALVVLTDWGRVGSELFVRRAADGKEIHTGVWARQLGTDLVPAAVFCEVVEGTYRIVGVESEDVTVQGGQVTDIDARIG
jgi:hypothetical protein